MLESAAEHRSYWSRTMDEAFTFMDQARIVPIEEAGEPMADLATCERAGAHWEVEHSALGELGAAFMRSSLVPSFVEAARILNSAGLEPIVVYAYRTPAMQRSLLVSEDVLDQVVDRVRWELGDANVAAGQVYDRLIVLCANSFSTGTHLSGTAVDIKVRDRETGDVVDWGAPYLELSERTPMASPFVSEDARDNRDRCVRLLSEAGFYPYPYEFWHYSRDDVYGVLLGHHRAPVRFGPVDVDAGTGAVTAIEAPTRTIQERTSLLEMIESRLDESRP